MIIFLIIVILGSNRIATSLRQRFARFLPISSPTPAKEITHTPVSFSSLQPTVTPTTPCTTTNDTTGKSVAGTTSEKGYTGSISEIPATGPNDLAWFMLGGSSLLGVFFKKLTSISSKK